jgi:hypothetical protein
VIEEVSKNDVSEVAGDAAEKRGMTDRSLQDKESHRYQGRL